MSWSTKNQFCCAVLYTHAHTRVHTNREVKSSQMHLSKHTHVHTRTHTQVYISTSVSHMLRKMAATRESGRRNAAALTYGDGDMADISIYTEPGGRNLLRNNRRSCSYTGYHVYTINSKMVKPHKRFQSQGHVKQNLTEHAYIHNGRREANQCRLSSHSQTKLFSFI